jgi:predicted MFS family arabinose efflux permease
LARFAYTPLIPPPIEAHWFSSADTVTLGAANFAGYLVGALIGRPLAAVLSNRQALRLLMVIATAAFFACAYPLSATWYFVWRFLSGLSGGAIMVLVATAILPHIPVAKRRFVVGMIFLGLGFGITVSGTVIPELLQLGIRETWIGLGILSVILTAASWFGWPASNPSSTTPEVPADERARTRVSLWILYGQYAANALGLVPGMVLLVDFIVRGLGLGAGIGAAFWVLYGLSGIVGPLVTGYISDRIGYLLTYRVALLLQMIAVGFLAFTGNLVAVGKSTVILGMFTVSVVPVVFGRVQEILQNNHVAQRTAWSRATIAFALFQALSGYGYAFLFSHAHESYKLIFLCGLIALTAALLVDIFVRPEGRR